MALVWTLRRAIIEANASTDLVNTINIEIPPDQENRIRLTVLGANEDNAMTGDLDIKNNTAINGHKSLVINGNDCVVDGDEGEQSILDRIFDIHATEDGYRFNVTFNNLTVKNGRPIGGGLTPNSVDIEALSSYGGGIRFVSTALNLDNSAKTLTLNNCVVTDCSTYGEEMYTQSTSTVDGGHGLGGGIYVTNANLSMTDSSVSRNFAQGRNVRSNGALTAVDNGFGGSGFGGGICIENGGNVLLTRINVQLNGAIGGQTLSFSKLGKAGSGSGGGIFVRTTTPSLATFKIIDSELAKNEASGGRSIVGNVNDVVRDARAGNGSYGGLGVVGTPALVTGCTFADNNTFGGSANAGTAHPTDSATAGNATAGGVGSTDAGSTELVNCTVSNNTATAGNATASLISTAEAFGGGVYECSLYNCTVANNRADASTLTQQDDAYGGGVYGGFLYSTIVVANEIDPDDSPNGRDIFGGTSYGHNLLGYDDGAGLSFNTANNDLLYNGDLPSAVLLPLDYYGGPTRTRALDFDGLNPAIDAGGNALKGLAYDQREALFARNVRVTSTAQGDNDYTDIGAFEYQTPRVTSVVVNAGQVNTVQRSRVTTVTVTFSTVVTFAGAVEDAFTLSRIGGGAVGGFTATVTIANSVTVVTLSGFSGAETNFGSLADGRYTLTVRANQVVGLDGNGDGTAGDDYTLIGTVGNGLFRLFGDVNADGVNNAADQAQFTPSLGSSVGQSNYRDYFDFDGDGVINSFDFGQMRSRFGLSVP